MATAKKTATPKKAVKEPVEAAAAAAVVSEKEPPAKKLEPKAQKARRAADAEAINPKEPASAAEKAEAVSAALTAGRKKREAAKDPQAVVKASLDAVKDAAAARKEAKQQAKRADPKRKRKLQAVQAELQQPVKVKGGKKAKASTDAPTPEALAAKLSGDTTVPAVAEKNPHAERKASKPVVLEVGDYRVFRDMQNRTCIRVSKGRNNVEFIPMDSAGVAVQKLSLDRFDARFTPYDYPVVRAAELYAESSRYFGYTEKARQHLEKLLDGKSGLSPVLQPEEGVPMDTKKKGGKKAKAAKGGKTNGKSSPFAADKLIKKGGGGNAAGLAKARAARQAGTANRYSGKKIKVLTKETGARAGSARHMIRKAVMACSEADKALAKTVTHDKVDYKITPKVLENMVKLKLISIS